MCIYTNYARARRPPTKAFLGTSKVLNTPKSGYLACLGPIWPGQLGQYDTTHQHVYVLVDAYTLLVAYHL